jgi:hypothetical protein
MAGVLSGLRQWYARRWSLVTLGVAALHSAFIWSWLDRPLGNREIIAACVFALAPPVAMCALIRLRPIAHHRWLATATGIVAFWFGSCVSCLVAVQLGFTAFGLAAAMGFLYTTIVATTLGCIWLLAARRFAPAILAFCLGMTGSASWLVAANYGPVASRLFFPEDTIYSRHYSELAFRKVMVGDSLEAVSRLLGEPLDSYSEAQRSYWYYSQHGARFKNYYIRMLVFSPSGRVVDKAAEFSSQ